MARQVSAIAESMFDAELKHVFKDTAKEMRNTVRVKTGVVGSSYQFPLMGSGMATKVIRGTDITPMNLGFSKNVATLENWTAGDYSDKFGAKDIKADEIKEIAVETGNAIKRRLEQIIIDCITGSGYVKANPDIAAGTTGITLAKIRSVKKAMDKAGVPNTDRFFTIGAAQLNEDLLSTSEVTSADFNTVKALVRGEVDTWMGFKWIMIGDRDEGGLPLASGSRTCMRESVVGGCFA